jgi:hypothetical protein
VMTMPSRAGDDATKSVLAMVWCCRRVMLVTTLSIRAGDGAVELCYESAAKLSIVTSPDLHMAIYALNDSSRSPMT